MPAPTFPRRPSLRAVLAAHAAYFGLGGLWPLLHYRSFEAVTGRKEDDWLVKTVAALMLASTVATAASLARPRPAEEARLVALGGSAALGWSAAWYALRGRVSRIYLADAAVEATLVAALLFARTYHHDDESKGASDG